MKLDRSQFIAALSAGTAHLLFTPLRATGETVKLDVNPLQKVTLGKSGITTTLLGFGTGVSGWNRSSYLTRLDKVKSIGALVKGYELGIRMFDLADLYGTHGLMKEALKEMDREKLTLVTKMWTLPGGIPGEERPNADIVVDRFRKELGVDVIDLVQLHCLVDAAWTDAEKRQMDILEKLKSKGVIRAHGTSVHSLEAMQKAAETDWVDVLHARINPYGIAMDRKDPEEVIAVMKKLKEGGKGIIGMKLVGAGDYKESSEKINQALKFVLGLNLVDMLIVGFETEHEISDYLARMRQTLSSMKA